jgi:hypothetical protein
MEDGLYYYSYRWAAGCIAIKDGKIDVERLKDNDE